jgi:hypothetical protein
MKPLWLVCEDGTEYLDRYSRFLDGEFRFAPAADGAAAAAALDEGADGIVLDLDFRRTPPDRLVDERGLRRPGLPEAERRRLAEAQGILILRWLRARGHSQPAILCADLDDPEQVAFLEHALAPLAIVPSHEGLLEIAARMRRFCNM